MQIEAHIPGHALAFRAAPLPAGLALGGFALAAVLLFRQGWYPDLGALWIAAGFFAEGQAHLVYSAPDGEAAAAWAEAAARHGFPDGSVSSYSLPPLWAALAAPLTRLVDAGTFFTATLFAQALLLSLAVLSARTIAGRSLSPAHWAMASTALMLLAATGGGTEQPRLAIAVLVLFAFDRYGQGDRHAAGALLALATTLGLAPVLFLAIFLAEKDRRALAAFAETAGALALVSVLLAGWPLHAEYLARQWALWNTFGEWLFDEIVALLLFLPGNCLDMFFQEQAAGHALFSPFPPALALGLKLAQAGGAIALLLASTRRPRPRRIAQRLLALALLAALPGPPGWSGHAPLALLLLPSLLAWLPGAEGQGHGRRPGFGIAHPRASVPRPCTRRHPG